MALLVGTPAATAGADSTPTRVEGFAGAAAHAATVTDVRDAVAVAATRSGAGAWVATANGGVHATGDAPFFGAATGLVPDNDLVAIAATPSGAGYWLVSAHGGVYTFGDAQYFGGANTLPLNAPIVGIAATPTGNGYWLVAADGGIFAFGGAPFLGSAGAIALNQPIVGMAARASGLGYWFVAADGGIFSYGDAPFLGSTGGRTLNAPIVGMAATPSGSGYWLAAADGGVFTFGDAPFLGANAEAADPVRGVAARPQGDGYWLLRAPSADNDLDKWLQALVREADAKNPNGLWDRMAACETGGNWAMKGSRFSGGVGFANSTWSAYRYDWMPANAGDASREEQIIVADRVLREAARGVPSRAWGCARKVGLP